MCVCMYVCMYVCMCTVDRAEEWRDVQRPSCQLRQLDEHTLEGGHLHIPSESGGWVGGWPLITVQFVMHFVHDC